MKTSQKVLVWNLIFLVFFASVGLLGLEYYFRVKLANHARTASAVGIPIFESDKLNTYRHRPNATAVNGYTQPLPEIKISTEGLRDQDLAGRESQPGILMIGDSFIFGTGVDQTETVSEVLERRINQKFPSINQAWQVWNAGHIGYSMDNYYLLAKKLTKTYQPRALVVNIFVANDVTELRRKTWEETDGDLVRVIDQKIYVNDHGQLADYRVPKRWSYLWAVLESKMVWGWQRLTNTLPPPAPTLTWSVFMSEQDKHVDPRMKSYWQRFFTAWNRLVIWGESQNLPILFVIIPMDVQVSAHYDDKYAPQYFDELHRLADRPQTIMNKFCGDRKLWCLDLLPAFRAHPQKDQLFFPHKADPHFSVLGHQVMGEILLRELVGRD